MTKPVYEIMQKGFKGDTDETDHLILWIVADYKVDVEKYCKDNRIETVQIERVNVHPLDPGVDIDLTRDA